MSDKQKYKIGVLLPQHYDQDKFFLLGKINTKIDNWRNICEWLENEGYKCQSVTEKDFPNKKNIVNVTNIRFENNEIKIGVNLQITIPVPTDLSVEGLDDLENDDSDFN